MGEREITAALRRLRARRVLYEMLTGDPPFTGSTAQAVVARVLTETPRADAPPASHDPAARGGGGADRAGEAAGRPVRHRGGVRRGGEREALRGRPSPSHPCHRTGRTAGRAVGRTGSGYPSARGGGGGRDGGGALGLAPPDARSRRSTGSASSCRRSRRSCRRPVRESRRDLAGRAAAGVRRPGESAAGGSGCASSTSSRPRRSPAPRARGTPFFSPDGRQVGFLVNGTTLRTVSLDGGPVLTLSDSGELDRRRLGEDGFVYFEVDSGIAPREGSSGGPTELSTTCSRGARSGPSGRCCCPAREGNRVPHPHTNQPQADFQIVGMKLPNGEPKVITRGVYARYSPDRSPAGGDGRREAASRCRSTPTSWRRPARRSGCSRGSESRATGSPSTSPSRGTGRWSTPPAARPASAVPSGSSREGAETAVDPGWQPQGVVNNFSLSPDGKALAVNVSRNGVDIIYVKQLPTGPYSRLTFSDSGDFRPTWSADGRSIIYLSSLNNTGGTPVMRRADGTGGVQKLLSGGSNWGQALQTRDGGWLVLRSSIFLPGKGDVMGVRMGDTTLVPLANGPALEGKAAVSPGQPVAGLHVGRVGHPRGLRPALPRRQLRAVAGIGGGRIGSGVVAQRAAAVLHQRDQRDDERGRRAGSGVLDQRAQVACSRPRRTPWSPRCCPSTCIRTARGS